jgi:CO dehydrogenase maturation factor
MTQTIAVAGKGGTGKTTVAALLIRYLSEKRGGTILAIDADPSSNLHYVLGLQLEGTIGDMREDMLDQVQASPAAAGAMPGGMGKQDYLDYEIRMLMTEGERVDLLAMGRPEGPGCYCAANHMIRVVMDQIGTGYDYVVMDNEAGMEHISRRTTRDVDHLILVTDTSQRGMIAAQRIVEMVPGLDVNIRHMHLVINRLPNSSGTSSSSVPPALAEAAAKLGIELVGTIPNDPVMSEFEFTGRPLVELPHESLVVQAVYQIADRIFSNGQG